MRYSVRFTTRDEERFQGICPRGVLGLLRDFELRAEATLHAVEGLRARGLGTLALLYEGQEPLLGLVLAENGKVCEFGSLSWYGRRAWADDWLKPGLDWPLVWREASEPYKMLTLARHVGVPLALLREPVLAAAAEAVEGIEARGAARSFLAAALGGRWLPSLREAAVQDVLASSERLGYARYAGRPRGFLTSLVNPARHFFFYLAPGALFQLDHLELFDRAFLWNASPAHQEQVKRKECQAIADRLHASELALYLAKHPHPYDRLGTFLEAGASYSPSYAP